MIEDLNVQLSTSAASNDLLTSTLTSLRSEHGRLVTSLKTEHLKEVTALKEKVKAAEEKVRRLEDAHRRVSTGENRSDSKTRAKIGGDSSAFEMTDTEFE